MNWNIAAESISLVILGIICVYARKGSHLPSLKNRIFHGCLVITFSAILTNILSTVMIYHYETVPAWMTWIVTTIYYILTPLMGLAYFLYTVSVIYPDSPQLKKVMWSGCLPGLLYMLLVLGNPFTKLLFDLNQSAGYTRGDWVFLTYLIFYAYCLASIILTLLNRNKMEAEIFRILAAFPILAVLVIIVQQLYPEVILSGSAATCALLIIYLHLQNKQISVDYLTNVPNHQELLDMLDLMVRKTPQKEFALLVVSLRDFRQVNNTCGQQRGDAFLKSVCHFLCGVSSSENVYRFSGDEFAILFTDVNQERMERCVRSIQKRMAEPWQAGDYTIHLSAVMGIIHHTDQAESLEQIVNAIEYAVAQAKSGKYGQICYCDQAMLDKLDRKQKIIRILKEQIQKQDFEMYYQPIYDVETGIFDYAESLMRIPHSEIGPIYPNEFIPVAEETGLIIDITYIILDKVCKFINRLLEKGIPIQAIHVNFSAVQFARPDLAERVLSIIHQNHTPLSAVKIEFTESTLAESTQVVTEFVLKMDQYGIKMGLDDFGTGYSNISTVINIPFETVKLDKSLVWISIDNAAPALAVKNLTSTFKQLGMKVVAEGIETEEQRKLVVDFGVDQIQGFFYAKPMPEEQTEQFLLAQMQPALAGAC